MALQAKNLIFENSSTKLIIAALNEEHGIGPTLTEFLDNLSISTRSMLRMVTA
jgi:hypothetical protein